MKKAEILYLIDKLANEAVVKKNANELIIHILNNSSSLFKYNRSLILNRKSLSILGISGEDRVNSDSEYSNDISFLFKHFSEKINEPFILNCDILSNPEKYSLNIIAHKKVKDFYQSKFKNHSFLVIPLTHPISNKSFYWIIEFFDTKNELVLKEELLYFAILATRYKSELFLRFTQKKASKNKKYLGILLLPLILFSFIYYYFNETISVEFKVIPKNKKVNYSRFNQTIKKVYFETGEGIKKGDLILEYENDELLLELSILENNKEKILIEKTHIISSANKNPEDLKRVALLDINILILDEEVLKIKQILSYNKIYAKQDGFIFFVNENLLGKSVRIGEKIFEIYKKNPTLVEIFINEEFADKLKNDLEINIYPRISPDFEMKCKVLDISLLPSYKINDKQFYKIKAEPLDKNNLLLPEMTGIAKIKILDP